MKQKCENLFIQIMNFYRNVYDPSNDEIERWLNEDETAAKLFVELTTEYENCGWQDIKEAPFDYGNERSGELLESLYQNAVSFFKKERTAP